MKAATLEYASVYEYVCISIHAAREGGDLVTPRSEHEKLKISIHAAREGGDGEVEEQKNDKHYFNPRRP